MQYGFSEFMQIISKYVDIQNTALAPESWQSCRTHKDVQQQTNCHHCTIHVTVSDDPSQWLWCVTSSGRRNWTLYRLIFSQQVT